MSLIQILHAEEVGLADIHVDIDEALKRWLWVGKTSHDFEEEFVDDLALVSRVESGHIASHLLSMVKVGASSLHAVHSHLDEAEEVGVADKSLALKEADLAGFSQKVVEVLLEDKV